MTLDDSKYKELVFRKYRKEEGELHFIELCKGSFSCLGISLVGSKNVTTMNTYIHDLKKGYPASESQLIHVGDEILEVNGQSIRGRSHLNVSPMFHMFTTVKILILRSDSYIGQIAISPKEFSNMEENCPQVLMEDYASNLSSHKETFESSLNDSSNESTENEICLQKPERKALKKLENLDSSDDRKFLEKDSKRLPLKIGKLSCIEIHKGSKALGIKVVGGNDMSLKEIIVYEIYEDGVAKKDGRIQIGDQIVEINDKKASSLSNREVMMELRKCVDTIKLLIMSSAMNSNIQFVDYNRLKEMHFHKEQLIVNVVKKPGKFLGFSVASVWNNKGLAITSVLKKNRSIDEEEEWLVGDEIYSVNDVVLEDLPSEEAVLLIKILSGNLKIELHRMKIGLGHQAVELAYPLSPFSPTSFNAEFSFNPNAVKHSKSFIQRAKPSCLLNSGS